jgi:lipoyl(octanoyl) transferase
MAVFVQILGQSDYADVHQVQQQLVAARAAGRGPDVVLLLEHRDVITIGRSRGAEAHVREAGDIPVVSVERGGDVTWHGPGQLVAYPIVKLEGRRADLHLHLHSLEDAVIGLLEDHGLAPTRDERNTGVWLPVDGEPRPRKVCSVGIACRRWVSWHGLALNVGTAVDAFTRIQPCGFDPEVMTRLADHLDWTPSVQALAAPLAAHLCRTLDIERQGAIRYADAPSDVLTLVGVTP